MNDVTYKYHHVNTPHTAMTQGTPGAEKLFRPVPTSNIRNIPLRCLSIST